MDIANHVASLTNGLDVLALVVERGGATATEIGEATRLNRTTAYRLAETLAAEGLLSRSGGRYRATIETKALSGGYRAQAWIEHSAVGPIRALGHAIDWPLALTTFAGTHMLVRYSTDDESPYVFRRVAAGTRLDVVGSAAGRVFLACSDPKIVEQALAVAGARSAGREAAEDIIGRAPFWSRDTLLRDLDRIARTGFASYHRADLKFHFLSVPILVDGLPFGCVTVRVIASAMRIATAEARFVPLLQATAREIVARIAADRDGRAIGRTATLCDETLAARRKS